MNATKSIKIKGCFGYSKRFVAFLVVGAVAYIGLNSFDDVHYANLRHDLEVTATLPDGSPEQAVAYMCLGKHLNKPVYAGVSGFNVMRWARDPNNPVRPMLKRIVAELELDWETKDSMGVSYADHYLGFTAGPVTAARTLLRESMPESLQQFDALLARHGGTEDSTALAWADQETLLRKALAEDAEGRKLMSELTSHRNIGKAARDYGALADAAATPGLALRWAQRNLPWLVLGFVLLSAAVRNVRRGSHQARQPEAEAGQQIAPRRVEQPHAITSSLSGVHRSLSAMSVKSLEREKASGE